MKKENRQLEFDFDEKPKKDTFWINIAEVYPMAPSTFDNTIYYQQLIYDVNLERPLTNAEIRAQIQETVNVVRSQLVFIPVTETRINEFMERLRLAMSDFLVAEKIINFTIERNYSLYGSRVSITFTINNYGERENYNISVIV